jgi:protein TonB
MKHICKLTLLFLLLSGFIYAQDTMRVADLSVRDVSPPPPDSNHVFTYVEIMPKFPGGQDSMNRFIQRNLQYPDLARDNNIQGTVYACFVVEKDGKVDEVKILRSMIPPCIACDSEVIRVIKKMPKWKPGAQQGKPVRVQFNLPVKFSLQ